MQKWNLRIKISPSEEDGEEAYVYRDIDDEQYSYKFSDVEVIDISNGEKVMMIIRKSIPSV